MGPHGNRTRKIPACTSDTNNFHCHARRKLSPGRRSRETNTRRWRGGADTNSERRRLPTCRHYPISIRKSRRNNRGGVGALTEIQPCARRRRGRRKHHCPTCYRAASHSKCRRYRLRPYDCTHRHIRPHIQRGRNTDIVERWCITGARNSLSLHRTWRTRSTQEKKHRQRSHQPAYARPHHARKREATRHKMVFRWLLLFHRCA